MQQAITGGDKKSQTRGTANSEDTPTYRTVELERINTIVIVPNDTSTLACFPYDIRVGVFTTSKFSPSNFSSIELPLLKKCLEKIANIVIEEKILEPNQRDLTVVLIATFVCCAIYNNVFTFKSKDYNMIEILPTIILGLAIFVIMMSKALVYLSSSRKMFEKMKGFHEVMARVQNLIEEFNRDIFSKKGYKMSINKHCGYVKLEHSAEPK